MIKQQQTMAWMNELIKKNLLEDNNWKWWKVVLSMTEKKYIPFKALDKKSKLWFPSIIALLCSCSASPTKCNTCENTTVWYLKKKKNYTSFLN